VIAATDRARFQALEAEVDGELGLALSVGEAVEELGTIRGGVAWSTIKVPLALAVAAREPSAHDQELIDLAITASDNDASRALWARLGPPAVAGAAVESVLAAAGDTSTKIETRILREEFTPFGQTEWSLASQVQLMAALPRLPHSDGIRALMRRIVPEQRWGLGVLGDDIEFKGGWGPDPDGRQLVRQMGIVGSRAVALAAAPHDGSFESGTALLDRLATWLGESLVARSQP
jgi:Beta-lactamase enzyme family